MTWGEQARALTLAIIITTPLLTACGPSVLDAWVGISVDAKGSPLIVLSDCRGLADTIFFVDEPLNSAGPESTRVFTVTTPAAGVVQFALRSGGANWRPASTVPIQALASGHRYRLKVDSKQRERGGFGVNFTVPQLAELKPGQVLVAGQDVPSTLDEMQAVCS